MTDPDRQPLSSPQLPRPVRKDPQKKTADALAPPATRSRLGLRVSAYAARGRFCLPHCDACSKLVWPPRDACPTCLATLVWRDGNPHGKLIAETVLETSPELYFRERMPWRVGTVVLGDNVPVMAHLHNQCRLGDEVVLRLMLDKSQRAVFMAFSNPDAPDLTEDIQLRELTNDPKHRRVLISDARTPTGVALASALGDAGCSTVFAGVAESWKRDEAIEALEAMAHVNLVPLDLTDTRSVQELAGEIGGKVDILIHNAEHVRPGGVIEGRGISEAKTLHEKLVFGFMRLAESFGPAMRGRGADGVNSASAWVNILSVYAHANWPAYGQHSAAHAAALSLTQCLRAEMQGSGVRVVNAFAGPLEQDWHRSVLPPKVTQRRLARDIVSGLQAGLQDIYIGDVARDVHERWSDDAKLLELELTGDGQ